MKWNEELLVRYKCLTVTLASGTEILFNSHALGENENWYLKRIVAMGDMSQMEPFLTGLDRASLVEILNGAGAMLGSGRPKVIFTSPWPGAVKGVNRCQQQ